MYLIDFNFSIRSNYEGLIILPERIQRVQTRMCFVWPFTTAQTLCKFGSQRLRV